MSKRQRSETVPEFAAWLVQQGKHRLSKTDETMSGYNDCNGVPFGSYRELLPASASMFPRAGVIKDREALSEFHARFDRCWRCGVKRSHVWRGLQCHHIFGGTKGRSDESTNFAMLCAACHELVNTQEFPLGRILFLKWMNDRGAVDWVRLAILRRCFLPDLIC